MERLSSFVVSFIGGSSVIPEWLRLLAAECYSGLYEEGGGEINLSFALS